MFEDLIASCSEISQGNTRLVAYKECNDQKTVQWLNDQELQRLFGLSYKTSLDQHRQWIKENTNVFIWAILSENNDYIGNILLHTQSRHKVAYLQMYIGDKQFRGYGHGRAALEMLLSFVFKKSILNRIWLHTLKDNPVSVALYQSVGFEYEGTERQALWKNDQFMDQMRWALLKRDFKGEK